MLGVSQACAPYLKRTSFKTCSAAWCFIGDLAIGGAARPAVRKLSRINSGTRPCNMQTDDALEFTSRPISLVFALAHQLKKKLFQVILTVPESQFGQSSARQN